VTSVPHALEASEPFIRLVCFVAVLAAMAAWETRAPRRSPAIGRSVRWPNNLGLVALNTALVRVLVPSAAVGLALVAEAEGWGLLNRVAVPVPARVAVSVILLDLAMYLQHVLFHAAPGLWRLHRMHHADLDVDVTTGVRFHPIEILLSMGIKLAIVAALGPPAVAVLIFDVLLNVTSLFNHGNVRIPTPWDRVLRWFVVTPDMHRVHHSVRAEETNSNFGFTLPWWDRMLGTYHAQPEAGHRDMTIGLEQFRTVADLRLDRMLLQPVSRPAEVPPSAGARSVT
jgi:sterol desaturase/sphingolipid hydroxylase (fatty acid hydroxylase superfamily)